MAEMPRARSLDEVRTFLLEDFNSEPLFYSSEIKQRPLDSLRPKISYNCVLVRRRRALVVASLIFEITSVEFLVEVVTALVTCSTWTNAEFLFRGGGLGCRDESSDLGDICEVCHLHGSSPSLLYLHVSCNWLSLAEAVVGGVSPNSALTSLTLHTWHNTYKFEDGKSLKVLIRSASMSNVKELVLRFPDCGPMNLSVENLVRCNTNLEKLTLCSTDPKYWVQLKDVTYTWTSDCHGRALHVKYSGINFLSAGEHIKSLAANFSVEYNPDGMYIRGTDISTLRLSLSSKHLVNPHNCEWVQAFRESMHLLVTSVTSMSARSTTLKHVQVRYELGGSELGSCRKLVDVWTHEKLRMMVRSDLRANTSLETLELGYWKLIRRGEHGAGGTDEWHTSYGGPCLRTLTREYVVKVQM